MARTIGLTFPQEKPAEKPENSKPQEKKACGEVRTA